MEIFQQIEPNILKSIGLDPAKLEESFLKNIYQEGHEMGKSAGTVGGARKDDRSIKILDQNITVRGVTATDFPQALTSNWKVQSSNYFPDETYRSLAEKAIQTFLAGFGQGALDAYQFEAAANGLNLITDGGFTKNKEFMAKIKDHVKRAQDSGDVLEAVRLTNLVKNDLEERKSTNLTSSSES